MVLMAAGDEADLKHMVATQVACDDAPSALRYPRGEGAGIPMPLRGQALEIGRGRIMREGTDIALVSYGGRLYETLAAAELLAAEGISATVADARFAKPLDDALLLRLAREHEAVITIEEGSIGGFGAMVLHMYAANAVLDSGLKIRTLTLPDTFLPQDKPALQHKAAGLDAGSIAATARQVLGREASVVMPLSSKIKSV
jgi:1-deoxy-D-xylulose-5-phosphate synthase